MSVRWVDANFNYKIVPTHIQFIEDHLLADKRRTRIFCRCSVFTRMFPSDSLFVTMQLRCVCVCVCDRLSAPARRRSRHAPVRSTLAAFSARPAAPTLDTLCSRVNARRITLDTRERAKRVENVSMMRARVCPERHTQAYNLYVWARRDVRVNVLICCVTYWIPDARVQCSVYVARSAEYFDIFI